MGRLLYACTIFLAAFLLFQIQPIIAKLILPWFGGTTAVWTTCLVFFQVVLLLGYLYAHWLIRALRPRARTILHVALLGLSLLCLPVIPGAGWKPSGGEEPAMRILGLLLATVGLPYFLLATTGPLLQAWYVRKYRFVLPYRLYALANLASVLALLAYPFLIEPAVATATQARVWSIAYAAFGLLSAATAIRASTTSGGGELDSGVETSGSEAGIERPDWKRRLLWMALAAFPSVLLLAVTNHLTQNVASVPFLWVLPLCIYLLSFILCFARDGLYQGGVYTRLMAVALVAMASFTRGPELEAGFKLTVAVLAMGLFVCCMFGHGELARLKPHPRHLTSFYCMVSLGGALGGLFVTLVAPLVFPGYFELPIGMAALALFTLAMLRRASRSIRVVWAIVSLFLLVTVFTQVRSFMADSRVAARNFYGSLRVGDFPTVKDGETVRILTHGAIDHGRQFLSPALRGEPTAYYGRQSGIGLVLDNIQRSPVRVGIIGLGAGTLATYGKPGDYYHFYEINPLVVELARSHFRFLADSRAEVDIAVGDGRLRLEREPPQEFDVLAVDAFSGDAIPVHLLTREAFQLYFRHLKPDGVLAMHITNRSLDLAPVVQKAAEPFASRGLLVHNPVSAVDEVAQSTWVLLAARGSVLDAPAIRQAGIPLEAREGLRVWTDDYSNLFQILR